MRSERRRPTVRLRRPQVVERRRHVAWSKSGLPLRGQAGGSAACPGRDGRSGSGVDYPNLPLM
ncbi:hypothetical protein [Haloferax sp. ATB1]|uniref:hypothetical protein n=1 Tax=Haloferax sp. ATB1 TaxID=1508454 RepID=UPI0005B1F47F|nr:hypothetical protein [Haloferax sp. ATB1]